jgi:2,3-bisphosphoglycerate-dependent phosphoglycerate mutase
MQRFYIVFIALFAISCNASTYYVVRHAEKVNSPSMSIDVPLTEGGKERAEALKKTLAKESITQIYSTNYNRTRATVMPIAEDRNIRIQLYDPRDTSFVSRLKKISKAHVLIVGHSNTVDDIVNQLSGAHTVPGDLPDSQYGDLFVIRKKGNKTTVEKKHFGL